MAENKIQPIGVFDSGFGGLTVLKELKKALPGYDFSYLGDNARTPYGTRSYEAVYNFTLEGVKKLFSFGCNLVILACNTASSKALRTIQQKDLPLLDAERRVLGVLRPSTEIVGKLTETNQIGVLGTTGTINSGSYPIEITKFFPKTQVFQQACPMWVPLVENNEHTEAGADYFVEKYIKQLYNQSWEIDTIILACTHYPLLLSKIKQQLLPNTMVVNQGEIVAAGLTDYLKRHPEMDQKCSKNGTMKFFTTDSSEIFDRHASIFYGQEVFSEKIIL